MIKRSDLRKVMLRKGYRLVSVPSGKGLMIRYAKEKIPYSSVISEFELENIINEVTTPHSPHE